MSASIALPEGIVQALSMPRLGRAARSARRWERSLGRRELFALDSADPVSVACLDGTLWVTLDHDCADYVLAPGQALWVPGGQRAVIQALAAARFGVTPA